MPSSQVASAAQVVANADAPSVPVPANTTFNWPSLDNKPSGATFNANPSQLPAQEKAKTFASVAAMKKVPPPPPPVSVQQQQTPTKFNQFNEPSPSSKQQIMESQQNTTDAKNAEEPTIE
jgi:hypothetical protein